MGNGFGAEILSEAGEAIGNIGRRLTRRRRARRGQEALERWLAQGSSSPITAGGTKKVVPNDSATDKDAIDASYRIINEEKQGNEHV